MSSHPSPMDPRPRRVRGRGRKNQISIDRITEDTVDSEQSKEVASQSFYSKTANQPAQFTRTPSHAANTTWKSQAVKDKEEYERIRQRVRHFAPEQFEVNAMPGRGRSEIFPQNVKKWLEHKRGILTIAATENKKNTELLKAQIDALSRIPKDQRNIKSVFGGPDGKILNDGLSPVLALPTIWSSEYKSTRATWPSKARLQLNGDSRECALAATKCGRFLPPPVSPGQTGPAGRAIFRRSFPLDQTGPVFDMGPRADHVFLENQIMNQDPTFEKQGSLYLGGELMKEVGEWKPVFVPAWQVDQREARKGAMVLFSHDQGFGFCHMGTPVSGVDRNALIYECDDGWQHRPIWW
jgi:hypothetical protein